MINYKIIDLKTYPHRSHLEYFISMSSPHVSMTADVDVTDLKAFCTREKCSFYLTFIHIAALSADSIPQFRQRIHRLSAEELEEEVHADAPTDGPLAGLEIREYEESPTSHTEPVDGDLYSYCCLRHHVPWQEYIASAAEAQQIARQRTDLDEDEEIEAFYFPTCAPWVRYTGCIHPVADSCDSNPRISWGKYGEDWRGRLTMPLTVMVHHGLVDGIHIGRFYKNVEDNIKALVEGRLEY